MDLEAPLDAWYVWLGVAICSLTLAGFTLALPTEPPPDSNEVVNTIDRVDASPYGGQATHAHNGNEAKVGTQQLALRNEGGTSRATVSYGSMIPLPAVEDPALYDALDRILVGEQVSRVTDNQSLTAKELAAECREVVERITRDGATWKPTDGALRVRSVTIADERVLLVDV